MACEVYLDKAVKKNNNNKRGTVCPEWVYLIARNWNRYSWLLINAALVVPGNVSPSVCCFGASVLGPALTLSAGPIGFPDHQSAQSLLHLHTSVPHPVWATDWSESEERMKSLLALTLPSSIRLSIYHFLPSGGAGTEVRNTVHGG